MTAPDEMIIDPDRLHTLGRMWPGTTGSLSPLVGPDPDEDAVSEQVADSVREAVDDRVREAMDALVNPIASVELTDSGQDDPQTWILYATASGVEVGAVVDAADRVSVLSASSVQAQMLANSATAGDDQVEFSVVLSRAEAWVLGALLDLQRRSALVAAAAQETVDITLAPTVIDLQALIDVLDTLARPENRESGIAVLADKPAWTVLWLLCGLNVPEPLSRSTIDGSLGKLAALGLVVTDNDDTVTLAPHVASFANRFLLTQHLAFLSTRHDRDDTVDDDELVCCRSDAAALCLVIDPEAPETIHLLGGQPGLWPALVNEAASHLRPLRTLRSAAP